MEKTLKAHHWDKAAFAQQMRRSSSEHNQVKVLVISANKRRRGPPQHGFGQVTARGLEGKEQIERESWGSAIMSHECEHPTNPV